MSSLAYRPEVDGLRAFAIIPVLIFHFGATWLPGGYLGVDVFFVISGYLISSILLREMQTGTFRFRSFWMRRLRRIAPALLAVSLLTLLASLVVIFPLYLPTLGADSLASTFSVTNFAVLLKPGNYWGPDAAASPFLHTWSLSVEEQFYLLFPAFLFLLFKLRWNVPLVLSLLTLASFSLFAFLTVRKPQFAFYLLPARGWELAVGAILAAIPANSLKTPRWLQDTLLLGSIVLILGSYFLIGGDESFSVGALFPVLGAAGVILFATQKGAGRWLLSNVPAVQIGKVSYSLYLWHWPVLVIAKAFEVRFQIQVEWWVTLALVVLLSIGSYFLVESPLRRAKAFWPPLLALLVPVLALGGFLWLSPPPSLPVEQFNIYKSVGNYDLAPGRGTHPTAYREEGILAGEISKRPPRIVVVGDSHGAIWGSAFEQIGKDLGVTVAFFTLTSNQPFFAIPIKGLVPGAPGPKWTSEQKTVYAKNLLEKLRLWKPEIVVLACKWQNYGQSRLQNAAALVQYCESLGTKVLLVEQAPVFGFGDFNAAQYLSYLSVVPQEGKDFYLVLDSQAKWKEANQRAIRFLSRQPSEVFHYSEQMTRGNQSIILSGRDMLYRDEDHMSGSGTQRLIPAFEALIKEHLVSRP